MARHRLALLIALAGAAGVANGADAQGFVDPVKPWPGAPGRSGPSPDEIINSLSPHAANAGPRGIRLRPQNAPSSSTSFSVGFSSGSADLSNEARATLDQVGGILADGNSGGAKVLIEGHSDTVGNRAANLALSQRRASAVQQYLVTMFGIAPDRVKSVGVGPDQLLVATPDQTPEARNRRASIAILAPSRPPAAAVQPPAKP
jgi:outer membrane protein OmpA-like peptidoglycan-associated protein